MKPNMKIKILLLSLVLFCYNCGEKIPIKEMALAKMEISKALSVNAKKYAPDEIKEAKTKLIECHELIKTDKLDKCKDTAVISYQKALEAYNKSIPLLAKDTIEIAEKSMEEADEAYADVLAEEEYKQTSNALAKANELFEQKTYYESYEKALIADKLAKDARNIAIGKKDILADAINEVKATLQDAEKYNASKYALEKVDNATENINSAESAYEELLLKKGFAAIEIARVSADEAYLMAIEGTAKDTIASARDLLAQASGSEGAEIARDELAGAGDALDLAESLSSESKFQESISSADESMRLAHIVLNTKKPEPEPKTIKVAVKGTETKIITKGDKDYQIYKVRYIPARRDCLWRISKKFYKDPLMWKNIFKANNDKINNPDLIWPDMLLKIPKLKKGKRKK